MSTQCNAFLKEMSVVPITGKCAVRICHASEYDSDFIRWTSNLLRTFILDGTIKIVKQNEAPDLMIISIWKSPIFPPDLPVILISNENWKLFTIQAPIDKYKAIIGLYPPEGSPTTDFIQYDFASVYYDCTVDELYNLRNELLQVEKTKFCCFVISNDTDGNLCSYRIELFHSVNKWVSARSNEQGYLSKQVDSGGKILNNIGYNAPRGIDFLRWIAQYRYMICIENSLDAHYKTEKPFQAWFAGTVPIYYGACVEEFNQESIISAPNAAEVISQLERLENNDTLYNLKRHADLCKQLSMKPFDDKFRCFIDDIVISKKNYGNDSLKDYIFLKNRDSYGKDKFYKHDLDVIDMLKLADKDPEIVAFNTLGYFKYEIHTDINDFITDEEIGGIYIKKTHAKAVFQLLT